MYATHRDDDAPRDQATPAAATLLNLPEDVENSIVCLLALRDLAIARRTNKKLAGWKYGPNVTELQLPSKYIPPSTLIKYYTLEYVVRIDVSKCWQILDCSLLAFLIMIGAVSFNTTAAGAARGSPRAARRTRSGRTASGRRSASSATRGARRGLPAQVSRVRLPWFTLGPAQAAPTPSFSGFRRLSRRD